MEKRKIIRRKYTNEEVYEIEQWAINLSKKERECPVVKGYLKTKEFDYEAYDSMHDADGIVGKSLSTRRL